MKAFWTTTTEPILEKTLHTHEVQHNMSLTFLNNITNKVSKFLRAFILLQYHYTCIIPLLDLGDFHFFRSQVKVDHYGRRQFFFSNLLPRTKYFTCLMSVFTILSA